MVIKLGNRFDNILINEVNFCVGAGTSYMKLAKILAKNGISGMEFFIGIPGTVGGAIKMNSGAYGGETSDFLESLTALDRDGKKHYVKKDDYLMTYRRSYFPDDWIYTSAEFRGIRENQGIILNKINQLNNERIKTQPFRHATGGSTFKNPKGFKAWELIKRSGCSDMSLGNAKVSPEHCNFLINNGNATSNDIEMLGEKIKNQVKKVTGISLDWEVDIIGEKEDYKETFV